MRACLLACILWTVAASVGEAGGLHIIGGLCREATLGPGGHSEGKIIIQNDGDTPQEVKVYQTDYLFTAEGKNIYGDPGSTPRSNGSWITFTPRQFVVPAEGTGSVYYTVDVPQNEDLTGTYWSMLMVEPLGEAGPVPTAPADSEAAVGIRTVLRYGIQLVTSIGDTGVRDVRFAGLQILAPKDNAPTLQLDIGNTGERALRPVAWAELYDREGVSVGRFEGGRLRIYPGCSARFRIDLSHVPSGTYKALIVADNGDEYVFGTQCEITLE